MHVGGFPEDVSEVRRSFHSILEFATRAVAVTSKRSASAIGFPGRDGAKRHVHSSLEVCGRRLPVAAIANQGLRARRVDHHQTGAFPGALPGQLARVRLNQAGGRGFKGPGRRAFE